MPTILIVEDSRTQRENMAELLELEGYTTITAVDGKDGFDKICHFLPDLIVCDLLMPKMDGLELLATLGKQDHLKSIPLIIFSARSEKKDIAAGMDSGAFDYIVKPSDLSDLLASIHQCLRSKKAF